MKYFYGEFDGEEFPTQDKLFQSEQLMDFVLQYGDQAMKAIEQLIQDPKSDAQKEMLEQLLKDGMIEKDGKGKVKLTPKAVTKMQTRALMEVFANLKQGRREGHEKVEPGPQGERIDGTKPYQFGDPVSEIDLHATLHNALQRHGLPQRTEGGRSRIKFDDRDFELHLHQGQTSCSTVVLIDQSGSMMRYGRFLSAKKVAMAMQSLVQSRFPQDTIDFVGFYSGAERLAPSQLPLMMPKPVTIYDYQVRMKVPLDQIKRAPQHFTNLHLGLQLARRILRSRGGENKQIFVITDGQPTAHVEGDFTSTCSTRRTSGRPWRRSRRR